MSYDSSFLPTTLLLTTDLPDEVGVLGEIKEINPQNYECQQTWQSVIPLLPEDGVVADLVYDRYTRGQVYPFQDLSSHMTFKMECGHVILCFTCLFLLTGLRSVESKKVQPSRQVSICILSRFWTSMYRN